MELKDDLYAENLKKKLTQLILGKIFNLLLREVQILQTSGARKSQRKKREEMQIKQKFRKKAKKRIT